MSIINTSILSMPIGSVGGSWGVGGEDPIVKQNFYKIYRGLGVKFLIGSPQLIRQLSGT